MDESLLVVTTDNCHFCARAHQVLDELGVSYREISVESVEAEALGQHGIPLAFLPVLTDGQRVLAYGRFSAKRLRRDLV